MESRIGSSKHQTNLLLRCGGAYMKEHAVSKRQMVGHMASRKFPAVTPSRVLSCSCYRQQVCVSDKGTE